jgi:hypothetical protein
LTVPSLAAAPEGRLDGSVLPDGERSATASISLQRTQDNEDQAARVFTALQRVEQAAVSAALE